MNHENVCEAMSKKPLTIGSWLMFDHPDHDEFQHRIDQGACLLAYGIDMEFLRVMLERERSFLQSVRG